MDFDFMEDSLSKNILVRDYNELMICYESKAFKSAIILSGSILELLLMETLNYFDEKNDKIGQYENHSLNNLLVLSKERLLISERSFNLSHVVRDYRNLIHPGKEIRKGDFPDQETSLICISLLKMITNELRLQFNLKTNCTAENILFKIQFESISIDTFLNLVLRLNKLEKIKLFTGLVDLSFSDKRLSLTEIKKFHRVLCNFVDNHTRLELAKNLVSKLLISNFESTVNLFIFAKDDIKLLEKIDQELILTYFLDKFIFNIRGGLDFDVFTSNFVFTIFSEFLHLEKVYNQFVKFLIRVIVFYKKGDYYLLDIYGQCIMNIDFDLFEQIIKYVKSKVSVQQFNYFYNDYESYSLF